MNEKEWWEIVTELKHTFCCCWFTSNQSLEYVTCLLSTLCQKARIQACPLWTECPSSPVWSGHMMSPLQSHRLSMHRRICMHAQWKEAEPHLWDQPSPACMCLHDLFIFVIPPSHGHLAASRPGPKAAGDDPSLFWSPREPPSRDTEWSWGHPQWFWKALNPVRVCQEQPQDFCLCFITWPAHVFQPSNSKWIVDIVTFCQEKSTTRGLGKSVWRFKSRLQTGICYDRLQI